MVKSVPWGDPKVPPSSHNERRFKELYHLKDLLLSFSTVNSGREISFFLTLGVLKKKPLLLSVADSYMSVLVFHLHYLSS